MTAHMTARLIKLLRPLVVVVAAGLPAGVAAAETLTVEQRSVADEKAVFATVESISVVPARGRIGGTVVQLGVREGDRVTRGQAIASIGDEKLGLQMKALDAQIEALQAQANQAQIDFTRIEGLVERGTLPRVKLDEARTALNVAENGLRARTAERAVVKLATERKHLTDIIKMVAYQAESDLLALLRPHYSRADQEGRTLLHELFAQPFHQLLEPLPCFAGLEVVAAEVAHLAGEVGRHEVELCVPFCG